MLVQLREDAQALAQQRARAMGFADGPADDCLDREGVRQAELIPHIAEKPHPLPNECCGVIGFAQVQADARQVHQVEGDAIRQVELPLKAQCLFEMFGGTR